MPISDRQRAAYDWYKHREGEFRAHAELNEGKLERHNLWRLAYYSFPYLLLETSQAIEARFVDIFANTVDISASGQIIPNLAENDGWFGRLFTELIEETNWRGLLTPVLVAEAMKPIQAYFKDGEPLGVRMFGDRSSLGGRGLVKYSKLEFVKDMHRRGLFRVSPASYYSKGAHLKAVKDFETRRSYKLPALNEALQGEELIEVNGVPFRITDGVIPIDVELTDYYLVSTCRDIDRRLPTDFEANAALVVLDRREFIDRLRRAMLDQRPNWHFEAAEVEYFDPYRDRPNPHNQEFRKHFQYAYQREHRCVLRPRTAIHDPSDLGPFFVELGSLQDIAEVVTPTR